MRTRILIYGIVILAVVALTALAYVAYQWYYTSFTPTPEKALNEYFTAFSTADYSRMYEMTRGVPGSPQTAAEFATQVKWLTKEMPPRISGVQLEPIGSQGTARYYRVQLKLTTADGSYRLVSMLVEVVQEGSSWKVSYPFAPGF